jgi:peptidoglycan/xylan/chitin deacetylase (PgdA/CDA1 family)
MPRSTTAIACFTFDNMGEAADIGAGQAKGVQRGGLHPSIARGYPNLYAVLERHAVRATFFVEGWNGEHHPAAVAEIVNRGHELGMHGWVHEAWATLDPAHEAELAQRATDVLQRAAGVRPTGFRAPGGTRSAHTDSILSALGYTYDASLGDGMRPQVLPSRLAQVPFVWQGVDGFYYLRDQPVDPIAVRDGWLRALARVAETGGLFVTICHAFITGVDAARLAALDAVMAAAVADERVVICTTGGVAADLRAAHGDRERG